MVKIKTVYPIIHSHAKEALALYLEISGDLDIENGRSQIESIGMNENLYLFTYKGHSFSVSKKSTKSPTIRFCFNGTLWSIFKAKETAKY
ncbi:MAG: hypothetical protein ACJAS1_000541 [Oleiphilaceae bacterium]|jgi:hypothetical protein